MATLRLIQTTDMNGLSDITPDSDTFSGSEFDVNSTVSGSVECLGSFQNVSVNHLSGTITDVLLDTNDFQSAPNLYFSDLSFQLSNISYGFGDLDFLISHTFTFASELLDGSDTIYGSTGNDGIIGFAGDDVLIGGAGADVLNGDDGNDTASYSTAGAGLFAGIEDFNANTGDAAGDTYISIENLEGSQFNDVLYGTGIANRLSGGAGNDILVGKAGADILDGGTGTDKVGYDASQTGLRADLLLPATNTGDAAGDVYVSIENLDGSSFDDILLGDNAANVIGGNLYHDTPSGNDTLYGRGGNDILFGYDGNDILNGGTGADTMVGGTGNDTYYVDDAGDVVTENPNEGSDTIYTSIDYTIGTGTQMEFLRANAGSKGIVLTGNNLANTIVGNTGADTLSGGGGNDMLRGSGGPDVLTGGAGADTFTYTALSDSTVAASGRDTITDFLTSAGDKIDLHLIDANAALAGNQAFTLIGTNAFSGVAGQLRYAPSGGNTLISADVNGDKAADFSILVNGAHSFAPSDFVL